MKHSEKIKSIIGEKRFGKENPFYGKHHTAETKRKISEALKGKSAWNRGKKFSDETRKKMSFAHKDETPWNKGKVLPKGWHHTEETKRKIREAHLKIKGGITPVIRLIRCSFKYRQWRQDVFIRDDFTCQKCGQRGGDLEVHHIKPFTRIVKEAKETLPLLSLYESAMLYTPLWDVDNGEVFCKECHKKTYTGKSKIV